MKRSSVDRRRPVLSFVDGRGRRGAAAALALGTVVATLAGCSSGSDGPSARSTAQKFLDAWAAGDVSRAANETDNPQAAQAALQQAKDTLAPTKAALSAKGGSEKDKTATIPFAASWTLPGASKPWTYDGSLAMVRKNDSWKVSWKPADLHPKLGEGQQFKVARELPDRAAILDRNGQPLFSKTTVVTVGINPSQVKDLQGLANTLAATLKISATDIVNDVRKAKPDQFVPVITLRQSEYQKVRSVIHPLAGTQFRTEDRVLGPTAQFAQPFLGRVGQVTADGVKESGGAYQAGDEIGVSGLQKALNDTLTGKAGLTISVVGGPSDGATSAAGGGDGEGEGDGADQKSEVIGSLDAVPGKPVKLALDPAVQNAADAAVATLPKNAAIVAVKPSTGDVLAIANGPKATFDMAMSAKVPAGSTFKIVTATALLSSGVVKSDATVDCPGTINVGGRTFHNENSFDLGKVPVRTAFAHSCNTTFIGLGRNLDPNVFAKTAASFGIGAGWNMPVTAFSGSVEPPKDEAARAADAIGQGTVQVSPFAMAMVAATVAHGSTPTPILVDGTKAEPKNAPTAPSPQALASLRDFMRAAVTEGTAKDLAGISGEPAGKTGTAEYGTETPPRSHAWFAGYRGDLAFAVFVEDGESSHTTAVPVAQAFLSALP